jgi:hypothetical protein
VAVVIREKNVLNTENTEILEKWFINKSLQCSFPHTELLSLSMRAHISITKSGSEVVELVY